MGEKLDRPNLMVMTRDRRLDQPRDRKILRIIKWLLSFIGWLIS